ncbi:hypothetical protein TVAG_026760 [Trichomonas vaginalis G3]|uniref:Uncharacterized protein n=1 Tax=Trichomonas vaginalis (strain ATCC PRA-98 / G3) TaxID=412133 RepID=A2DZ79_TRIV3|nr:Doublecortin (DC) family [Trichomonas vaginalis G3]EAY14355.1 hypothetical protein TVAG_026760 [Trichomonas vaginalis G3]KAI5517380.1 Doublecortin (DC) family [Trichomonas vaginalis G3]|eukprot:XP_001326578.1 hypothetical protein [Trichomonas vaginalis G3]
MESRPDSPRKNLADRSLHGFIINIQKNAYPRGNQMRYCFNTIDKLKLDAVKILSLPSKVEKIFDETGKAVTSADQVKEKGLYYISCGEKYASGMPSPRSKSREVFTLTEEEEEEPERVQTSFEASVAENIAKKQQEAAEKEKQAAKSPDIKKEKEMASFNRLIAISNKSVQEAYLESTLAAFASTEPDQKAKLTKFDQLSNLSKNTAYYDFINHLVTNQMAPNYGTSELQDEVDAWCMDALNQLTISDINFIISGLPSTGKSSTLYSLSTILFRKIQQSSANGSFLFFPLNFEKLTLEFNSIKQIYNVFVTNTLNAARYSNYAIAPFVSSLCQWFISIPTANVFPSFPQMPEHVHGIDFKAIRALGQSIFDICKVKSNLQKFIGAITDFPANFAQTIGLPTVLFILDHFDYCDVEALDESMFPDSIYSVKFAPEICRSISGQKYLVSCENEQAFAQCFTCEGATPIDTEGICRSHVDGRTLTVKPMKIELTIEDCIGAPGIIAAFEHVCDLAAKVNTDPAQPKGIKIMSAVSRSRKYILKREVMRLFKVLFGAGNNKVTLDTLNDLEDSDLIVNVDGEKNPQGEEGQNQEEEDGEETTKTANSRVQSSPSNRTKASPAKSTPAKTTTPTKSQLAGQSSSTKGNSNNNNNQQGTLSKSGHPNSLSANTKSPAKNSLNASSNSSAPKSTSNPPSSKDQQPNKPANSNFIELVDDSEEDI